MKHVLLFLLSFLIAAPVWAEEAVVPSAEPAIQQAQPVLPATSDSTKIALLDDNGAPAPEKVRWSISGSAPTVSAALVCNINCQSMTCGGIAVCAKKKPYPLCTVPCP